MSVPRIGPAALIRIRHIHQRLQSNRRCSARSIAESLEVSSRTIRRDIDLLRDFFHAPIEWEPSTQTYFYSGPFELFSSLTLTTEEALALALAGHTFSAWRGSTLGAALHTVIRRIAETVGDAIRIPWDSVAQSLHQPPVDATEHREQTHLPIILDAILHRRRLKIEYRKPAAQNSIPRRVDPLNLTFLDHRATLVAFDAKTKAIRKFLLARMDACEVLDQTFSPPANFNVNHYLAGSLGLFTGDAEHTVTVRFDAYAAAYQRERPWHPSQQIKDLPDGTIEVTYRLNNLTDVKRLILSWGQHATVLAPPELLADFQKITEDFQKKYS